MLKRALKLLVVASVAVGMASAAENPFIGGWKLNSSMSRMPDEMKVESKGANTYCQKPLSILSEPHPAQVW